METQNAEMLESLLPSKFQYKIKEVKILEQSKILEEVKFRASFEANICTKEDAEELFFVIASKNGTESAPERENAEWIQQQSIQLWEKNSRPKISERWQ